ncbi:hypothetical protein NW754_004053 [Fusarium falciforme]|uniref:carbonic anhydrase n=1 Tax=Fusarium falciforme TaxID=195108 RepID=A0A9W8QT94_9HYPO|nr:hypothetical protein NW754_004053 [Fusarium falciforme]KAJ4177504.1 hypothetical protein NW755_013812 [Fusarium falciforme]KAJ4245103.1 hypothetical protein NW757_010113 [Fusarium falciforme]
MAGSLVLRLGLLAVLASKAWASCAYGTLLHPRAEEGTVDVNIFGYTGEIGPTKWVALSAENALCSTGTNQSPIDMVDGAFTIIPAAELGLSIPDMPEGTEFENLGTTVEVVAGEGTMAFDGVTYTLQQFHFHLPSEHLDNGTSMAMEMHMVWEGAAGEIAVIGAFIDIEDGAGGEAGAAPNATAPAAPVNTTPEAVNSTPEPAATPEAQQVHRRRDGFLKMLRKKSVKKTQEKRQLPSIQGHFFLVNTPSTGVVTASTLLETVLGSVEEISEPGTVTKTQPLIMSELVNTLAAGSFQTYNGSLTTPPCSEGVRWLVSDQKLSIQTATFSKTRTVIGFNSRFPQGALGEPNVLQQ